MGQVDAGAGGVGVGVEDCVCVCVVVWVCFFVLRLMREVLRRRVECPSFDVQSDAGCRQGVRVSEQMPD